MRSAAATAPTRSRQADPRWWAPRPARETSSRGRSRAREHRVPPRTCRPPSTRPLRGPDRRIPPCWSSRSRLHPPPSRRPRSQPSRQLPRRRPRSPTRRLLRPSRRPRSRPHRNLRPSRSPSHPHRHRRPNRSPRRPRLHPLPRLSLLRPPPPSLRLPLRNRRPRSPRLRSPGRRTRPVPKPPPDCRPTCPRLPRPRSRSRSRS